MRWLFLDMNSYFASVEQQDRPALRGRPVAVAPVAAETTCCIAASYEAKSFGVKTGTMIAEARRRCPGLAVMLARPERYIEVHRQIVAAVDRVLPVAQVCSIDEMACRLAPDERNLRAATALALRVKASIRDRVGAELRCSAGVGPNHLLAKVAADMRKPDGFTALAEDELPGRLHGLKLEDFPGIGPRMGRRLLAQGIATVQQLCEQSPAALSRAWGSGILGARWHALLRGADLPEPPASPRTVGHSKVLAPQDRRPGPARAMLMRLGHKAATRLRRLGMFATGVAVRASYYAPHGRWQARRRLPAFQDTLTLLDALAELWRSAPDAGPIQVGVVLEGLVAAGNATAPLFEDDRRHERLSAAMDRINERFGGAAAYFGAAHDAPRRLDARIAFTRIPDPDVHDG